MSLANRAKILVVDDNSANRELAKETLVDEGYEVILANDGARAIEAFEQTHPDCIVLDVRMPDMDGFAVCEHIRSFPDGADTPIVFVTALRDVETFDRALRVGGDDFLTKPVRPTELLVRVQSALKLRRIRVELREHYDLLKKQRNDLMRLQLQKERLMAFIVHDLKNPVTAMDLLAQVLLREEGASDTMRECADQIRTEARQLGRMIMNLLDLSKADEGMLAPRRSDVALGVLTRNVIAELETLARDRQVSLVANIESAHARGDEDLLRRMLTNLVENAIRHAPADTEVAVTTRPNEQGVEIRIIDAGEGIPADMRTKIFQPFVQLEADPSASRAGRGLGLAFCQVVATAHGGRIWVEDSKPGSVFCVSLPHDA